MARPSRDVVKINFYIDEDVLKAYKWLAKSRTTTYSELLRIASKRYVLDEVRKEQSDIATFSEVQERANG